MKISDKGTAFGCKSNAAGQDTGLSSSHDDQDSRDNSQNGHKDCQPTKVDVQKSQRARDNQPNAQQKDAKIAREFHNARSEIGNG